MSLGGGANTALDNAVANSIASGVTYAVAAGNSNANACNFSPARVGAAITVGADHADRRPGVVLQLRHLPGHLRARRGHHRRPGRRRTPPPTRSAARRWRPRTSPARPRWSWRPTRRFTPGAGARPAGRRRHHRRRDQPGHRLAQPAAVRQQRQRHAAAGDDGLLRHLRDRDRLDHQPATAPTPPPPAPGSAVTRPAPQQRHHAAARHHHVAAATTW